MHSMLPLLLDVPGGHGEQELDRIWEEKNPLPHSKHSEDPVEEL